MNVITRPLIKVNSKLMKTLSIETSSTNAKTVKRVNLKLIKTLSMKT